MNSPWGWMGHVMERFGFTQHQVLWKVSKLNIQLMMADKLQVTQRKKRKEVSGAELDELLGL